jgi:hypothetical protein
MIRSNFSLSLLNINTFAFSIIKLRENNLYRGNYFIIEENKKTDLVIYDLGDDEIGNEEIINEIIRMEIAKNDIPYLFNF